MTSEQSSQIVKVVFPIGVAKHASKWHRRGLRSALSLGLHHTSPSGHWVGGAKTSAYFYDHRVDRRRGVDTDDLLPFATATRCVDLVDHGQNIERGHKIIPVDVDVVWRSRQTSYRDA